MLESSSSSLTSRKTMIGQFLEKKRVRTDDSVFLDGGINQHRVDLVTGSERTATCCPGCGISRLWGRNDHQSSHNKFG